MAQVMSGCGGFLTAWGELAYLLGCCLGKQWDGSVFYKGE